MKNAKGKQKNFLEYSKRFEREVTCVTKRKDQMRQLIKDRIGELRRGKNPPLLKF